MPYRFIKPLKIKQQLELEFLNVYSKLRYLKNYFSYPTSQICCLLTKENFFDNRIPNLELFLIRLQERRGTEPNCYRLLIWTT